MQAVIQRVAHANVMVDGELVNEIGKGFLVLVGICQEDTEADADILAAKISGLRIFEDENGKMNLPLSSVNGEILAISNFTLYADCRKGKRPSFINAALPQQALPLYDYFCTRLKENGVSSVKKGVFGADMKVSLLNDGPITIVMKSEELKKHG